MEICGKTHEKEHDGMYNEGSEVEQLWAEMVSEGTPERRGDCGNEAGGAYDDADPKKGLRKGVRADVENIEGKKDIDKIKGKG